MNFPDTLSIIRKCRTLTDNCQSPYRFLESTEIWSMSGANCQIIDWPYLHCGRTLLLAPYTWYWNHDSTQHRDLIYEWGELSSHRYLSASWRCRLATKSGQLHFLHLKTCNSASGKGVIDESGHFSFLNTEIPGRFFYISFKEEKNNLLVFRRLIHLWICVTSCNW